MSILIYIHIPVLLILRMPVVIAIYYIYIYIHTYIILYTTAAALQGVFSETLVYDMSFRGRIILLLCTISTDSCDVYLYIHIYNIPANIGAHSSTSAAVLSISFE